MTFHVFMWYIGLTHTGPNPGHRLERSDPSPDRARPVGLSPIPSPISLVQLAGKMWREPRYIMQL